MDLPLDWAWEKLSHVHTEVITSESSKKGDDKLTSSKFERNVQSKLYHIETSITRANCVHIGQDEADHFDPTHLKLLSFLGT